MTDVVAYPPIDAQGVVDLVFAGTAFSSSNERARLLGEKYFVELLASMRERFDKDARGVMYLDALMPTIASALRAFAVEKQNYKRDVLPLEDLLKFENSKISGAEEVLPIVQAGAVFQRWATRSAILAAAAAAGLSSVAYFDTSRIAVQVAALLASATATAVLCTHLTRRYRRWQTENLISSMSKVLDTRWRASYLSYEAILVDCLLQSIRTQETWYPNVKTFSDGHLFPRPELPILPPPNADQLCPSKRGASELLKELRAIATARMSLRPAEGKYDDKLSRLEAHVAGAHVITVTVDRNPCAD